MHIVALAAGYVDAPPVELVMAPRKQVLVAVTSNWQVLCLDHNLRLQWETTILVSPEQLLLQNGKSVHAFWQFGCRQAHVWIGLPSACCQVYVQPVGQACHTAFVTAHVLQSCVERRNVILASHVCE